VLDAVAIALRFVAFAHERLHGADRAHRLLHLTGDFRELVLYGARLFANALAEVDRRDDRDRHDREHQHRQLDVDDEQHHERTEHLHAVAQRDREVGADDALHDRDVRREAPDELAGAPLVKPR
jgi:hypothetical protein